MTRDQRVTLMQTALGKTTADVILTGGQVVNGCTGEMAPHVWVLLKGERKKNLDKVG